MVERLNSGQRLIRQRKIMMEAQRIKATLDAAKRRWVQIIQEANELGLNLDTQGILRPVDSHIKNAWKLVNFMELSNILTGGPRNITRNVIPSKYAIEVFEYLKAMEDACSRVFKNRYAKNSREREYKLMNETLKKKKTRKVVRRNLIARAEIGINSYRENLS